MNELQKYEDKQVAVITKLQERSNNLAATAKGFDVHDAESLKEASALVKEINAHKSFVKDQRMELTRPLNGVIEQLIAREKEVLLPLDEGKAVIGTKILDYNAEQERLRIEEETRIFEITEDMRDFSDNIDTIAVADEHGAQLKDYYAKLAEGDQQIASIKRVFLEVVHDVTERKSQLEAQERARIERERQEAEQKRLDEERAKQSAEEARIAAERKKIDDEMRRIKQEREDMERERQKLAREKELQEAEQEAQKAELAKAQAAKSTPKVNAVTLTKFEVVAPELVAREYCSPDLLKIRESVKNGVTVIAGVRIYTETKVR